MSGPVSGDEPCPHCKLPRVLPDVCTPEVNAVIEQQIAEGWDLVNAGFAIGLRSNRDELRTCLVQLRDSLDALVLACQSNGWSAQDALQCWGFAMRHNGDLGERVEAAIAAASVGHVSVQP